MFGKTTLPRNMGRFVGGGSGELDSTSNGFSDLKVLWESERAEKTHWGGG